MKAKEIQELIDFISNSGLAEVKIKTDEIKLSIKKNSEKISKPTVSPSTTGESSINLPVSLGELPAAATPSLPLGESTKYLEVKSPMIGTFYRTSNPDSDPFVNVGDTITAGQTVCIIEAMKLFNEIESEVTGKVVKILVENSSPVEYDQPLFLIDPAG